MWGSRFVPCCMCTPVMNLLSTSGLTSTYIATIFADVQVGQGFPCLLAHGSFAFEGSCFCGDSKAQLRTNIQLHPALMADLSSSYKHS